MADRESPIDKQIRLLRPMLEYCDVRELTIWCGSSDEVDAVGLGATTGLDGRLAYEQQGPTGAILRITFVPPEKR